MTKDTCSNPTLLTVEQARERVMRSVAAVVETEELPLKTALGRVLAESLFSPINLPPHRNAAMDGYAFSSKDAPPENGFSLTLVGISWAGRPFTESLQSGQCVQIFTGAVVPENADTVIMQESVDVSGDTVHFPSHYLSGENIRKAGEDIKQHALLLAAGKKISAIDLGLLAAAGIAQVTVKRQVKIAFFSTGNELVALGQPLAHGQIYDSNRYTLHGLLADPCFEAVDCGAIADDKALLERSLLAASHEYDVIITSGGASIGSADYVKEVLEHCGEVHFWKIAMKPGKPLAFGQINRCIFFGLPGNPLAVIATFDKIVRPALQHISGSCARKPLQIKAICNTAFKKLAGREEYRPGFLCQQPDGTLVVESAKLQGSHLLSNMRDANCYIVLPSETTKVVIGEKVVVEPFLYQA